METRVRQASPPSTLSYFERREKKLGTRMERVPTARWNALRDRVAITLMFLGHKNETFFRWSLRLVYETQPRSFALRLAP
jgi:hypothetical protein